MHRTTHTRTRTGRWKVDSDRKIDYFLDFKPADSVATCQPSIKNLKRVLIANYKADCETSGEPEDPEHIAFIENFGNEKS